jgi:hypothetical protein
MTERTRALFENLSTTLNQRMSKKYVCFSSIVDKMSALLLGVSKFEKLMFVHHNHIYVTFLTQFSLTRATNGVLRAPREIE